MKNLFSLMLVAMATLSIACGGNANRAAQTTEEATEVVEVVAEEACCEEVCDEACCDGEECEEKVEVAVAE